MKTTEIKSLAAIAVATFTLLGCAGSNDRTTAMDDTVTMSETQTMTGTTDETEAADVTTETDVTTEMEAPATAISVDALSMENTEDVGEMFGTIANTESYTVLELARQSPNLSTFVQLMESSGVADQLTEDGTYTIFAPTNEAFSKMDRMELESLLRPENKAKLSSVLMSHVLPSEVNTATMSSNQRIRLGENSYIPITTTGTGTQITVGGANIVVRNVEASNGVIHVVDNVIKPTENAVEGGGPR